MMLLDPRYTWMRQLSAFAILLAVWEAAGRPDMLDPMYMPNPSRIGAAIVELFSDGRIWPHLEATFTAALGGLALGLDRFAYHLSAIRPRVSSPSSFAAGT